MRNGPDPSPRIPARSHVLADPRPGVRADVRADAAPYALASPSSFWSRETPSTRSSSPSA
ncbi:hypothetical protein SMALB_5434 [Streptomyces malaysiensis]|uniref:Uncharacterized protein n=1 Tax=Streptomyces malaysiensis TaxID=92644 RepID=A0A7X5X654_STRMQ|nr:hypothetical protein [Streptomyces malaysiensis]